MSSSSGASNARTELGLPHPYDKGTKIPLNGGNYLPIDMQ